jgi:hypothetical protein
MIYPSEITDWRNSISSRPKGVKLKMTGRKLRSGVNGQRGVKAKLRKTNRCTTRAKLYTDIRCALLPKEWSMVDGPASADSIDPYGLAMNLPVSYRASHSFVIRSVVGLEGRVKGSTCHQITDLGIRVERLKATKRHQPEFISTTETQHTST